MNEIATFTAKMDTFLIEYLTSSRFRQKLKARNINLNIYEAI